MLVLSRQANQSIQIGDSITLTIDSISPHGFSPRGATIKIDAESEVLNAFDARIYHRPGVSFFLGEWDETIILQDNIEITIEWLNHCDIKLRIEAPRDIKILRSELLHKLTESPEALSRVRDRFASLAMQAELNTAGANAKAAKSLAEAANTAGRTIVQQIAHNAYEIAEAMMTERAKRRGN